MWAFGSVSSAVTLTAVLAETDLAAAAAAATVYAPRCSSTALLFQGHPRTVTPSLRHPSTASVLAMTEQLVSQARSQQTPQLQCS
jgi:hypothetical protein